MIKNKEICKELAAKKATIIVGDGFNVDGTPRLVIRKVTGVSGAKHGRDSYWCVNFDQTLTGDCIECTSVAYPWVLGYYMEGRRGSVEQLIRSVNSFSHLTDEQKAWLIADATTRMVCCVGLDALQGNGSCIL